MIEPEVPTRSGTTADWAATTLVLGVGEIGINTDTRELRIGDGTSLWAALPVGGGSSRKGKTTLVAGTKTVAETGITANSIILATVQALGTVTAAKAVSVTARSVGVSFTLTSSDNTDTSVVGYLILEP